MTLTYYLAGPMTGKPGFNYRAFEDHAAYYRGRNLEIKSPHEIHGGDTSKEYTFYIREGLKLLLDCNAMILLPDWRDSRGATLEEGIAHTLNMFIYEVGPNYKLIHSRRGNQDVTGI